MGVLFRQRLPEVDAWLAAQLVHLLCDAAEAHGLRAVETSNLGDPDAPTLRWHRLDAAGPYEPVTRSVELDLEAADVTAAVHWD